MIIIFALVLVSAVHSYPPGQILYSKDLSNSVDEVYGSYLAVSNNRKDHNNKVAPNSEAYLKKLIAQQREKLASLIKPEEKSQRVERTAYLHIQTRQKNKRYASYKCMEHNLHIHL